MVFEKNKPIAETTEEEEILSQTGKKDKNVRMYGFYIYSILLKESNENRRFTCKKLAQRVLDRYKIKICLSTIQNTINNLQQSGSCDELCGDAYHGYYFEDNDKYIPNELALDDIEINMIGQAIHNATIIPFSAKKSIVNKLKIMGSEDLKTFFDNNLSIPKEEKQNGLYNLFAEDMIKVMNEHRPIILKLKNQDRTFEFNTYNVLSNDKTYKLVGAEKDSDRAKIINFNQIEFYEIREKKTFWKKQIKVDNTFDESTLIELKTMSPGIFIKEI